MRVPHRTDTWQPELVDVLKVGLAMLLCPKIQDAASPQAVLHSHLHSLQEILTLVQLKLRKGRSGARLRKWIHTTEGSVGTHQ